MHASLRHLLEVPVERRVYLDLDDVLAETTSHIVTLLNQRFSRRVRFQELRDFDLGVAFGLTADERHHAMESVHEETFLGELPVREGALEILEQWSEAGHHLAVITGRPPDTHGISQEWLHANRIPHDTFLCIDKYARYVGHRNQIPLAALETLEFGLAVEDSLEMARFLASRVPGRVLLMDRPWNRGLLPSEAARSGRIRRVSGWSEVAPLLRGTLEE